MMITAAYGLQDIAILIFKAVNGILPGYVSDLCVVRNYVKCSRDTNKLVVPSTKTTNLSLKSADIYSCQSVEFVIGWITFNGNP